MSLVKPTEYTDDEIVDMIKTKKICVQMQDWPALSLGVVYYRVTLPNRTHGTSFGIAQSDFRLRGETCVYDGIRAALKALYFDIVPPPVVSSLAPKAEGLTLEALSNAMGIRYRDDESEDDLRRRIEDKMGAPIPAEIKSIKPRFGRKPRAL